MVQQFWSQKMSPWSDFGDMIRIILFMKYNIQVRGAIFRGLLLKQKILNDCDGIKIDASNIFGGN